jgi:hypothetical protein
MIHHPCCRRHSHCILCRLCLCSPAILIAVVLPLGWGGGGRTIPIRCGIRLLATAPPASPSALLPSTSAVFATVATHRGWASPTTCRLSMLGGRHATTWRGYCQHSWRGVVLPANQWRWRRRRRWWRWRRRRRQQQHHCKEHHNTPGGCKQGQLGQLLDQQTAYNNAARLPSAFVEGASSFPPTNGGGSGGSNGGGGSSGTNQRSTATHLAGAGRVNLVNFSTFPHRLARVVALPAHSHDLDENDSNGNGPEQSGGGPGHCRTRNMRCW